MVQSLKQRLIKYALIALIATFFALPLTMVCLYDCSYYNPKKIASVLLIFFR